jgi:hypothetical protein
MKKKGIRGNPIFKTEYELQEKINEYFETGIPVKKVVVGSPNNRSVEEIPVPTISGLCLYLGFESRQSFYALEKLPQFSYTIKKARLGIELVYEEFLHTGSCVGAIFALKNFGWIDKTEVDHGFSENLLEKLKDVPIIELVRRANAIIAGKLAGA